MFGLTPSFYVNLFNTTSQTNEKQTTVLRNRRDKVLISDFLNSFSFDSSLITFHESPCIKENVCSN